MVVRMRKTSSKTRQGRSHRRLKEHNLSTCTNCGDFHRPHHMCLSCGYYNGRQVIDLAAERAKRDARIKAKEERIKGETSETDEPAETTSQSPTDDVAEEMKAEAPTKTTDRTVGHEEEKKQ